MSTKKEIKERKIKATVKNAKQMYEDKSYAETWHNAYVGMSRISFVPSLFSIGFGSLLFLQLFPSWHWLGAIALGVIANAVWELGKRFCISEGFYDYYRHEMQGRQFTPYLLIAGVVLAIGSMGFALFGASQGYDLASKHSQLKHSESTILAKDSLSSGFDAKIEQAKADAQQFFENNTVISRGKRVLRIKATNVYNQLQQRILELEDKKEDEVGELAKKAEGIEENIEKANLPYFWIVLAFSMLCETSILWMIWFSKYYPYMSALEDAPVKQEESQPQQNGGQSQIYQQFPFNPLYNPSQNYHSPTPDSKAGSNGSKPRKVGFLQGHELQPDKTPPVSPVHATRFNETAAVSRIVPITRQQFESLISRLGK